MIFFNNFLDVSVKRRKGNSSHGYKPLWIPAKKNRFRMSQNNFRISDKEKYFSKKSKNGLKIYRKRIEKVEDMAKEGIHVNPRDETQPNFQPNSDENTSKKTQKLTQI